TNSFIWRTFNSYIDYPTTQTLPLTATDGSSSISISALTIRYIIDPIWPHMDLACWSPNTGLPRQRKVYQVIMEISFDLASTSGTPTTLVLENAGVIGITNNTLQPRNGSRRYILAKGDSTDIDGFSEIGNSGNAYYPGTDVSGNQGVIALEIKTDGDFYFHFATYQTVETVTDVPLSLILHGSG